MDAVTHHSHIDAVTAARWVNAPVAGYLFGLWLIRDRFLSGMLRRHVLLAAAIVVALFAVLGAPVWLCALALVTTVVLRTAVAERFAERSWE